MSQTAAVLTGPGQFALSEHDLAAAGPGEVVVQIHAVGVCGSDFHMFADGRIGNIEIAEPLVLGLEFMGVVVQAPESTLDGDNRPLGRGTG